MTKGHDINMILINMILMTFFALIKCIKFRKDSFKDYAMWFMQNVYH